MSDDFDWSPDNSSLVLATQMAVAVYENGRGEVAIRQQADASWQEEDSWVYFTKDRAVTVARAILEVAGIDPADAFPELYSRLSHDVGNSLLPDRPKKASGQSDPTAAARQRRYRERHANRDAVTSDAVTERNVTPANRDSTDISSNGPLR